MQPYFYFTRRDAGPGGYVQILRGVNPGTGHGEYVKTVRACNAARAIAALYRLDVERQRHAKR